MSKGRRGFLKGLGAAVGGLVGAAALVKAEPVAAKAVLPKPLPKPPPTENWLGAHESAMAGYSGPHGDNSELVRRVKARRAELALEQGDLIEKRMWGEREAKILRDAPDGPMIGLGPDGRVTKFQRIELVHVKTKAVKVYQMAHVYDREGHLIHSGPFEECP